ncbi:hypothetical protein [Muricauda sp. MAR_2010_75]|jgi:hypothetical protein|uniref:hypothetical protein n=1 Tax=Allomuricauda sp. MAR_2010_75 TaxID=1250232 RepID=UPI000559CE7E|nr:hypothetical protein [Muricauda sp. MAR_2010_75]
MKKALIIFILSIFFLSCDCKNCGDHRNFIVTDFSQKRVDTLVPYKNKSYVGYFIRIKGYVNDTIKIKREGYYDKNLIGKIDTLMNGDYYGTENIIWTFDPYRASEGKLEIEYSL